MGKRVVLAGMMQPAYFQGQAMLALVVQMSSWSAPRSALVYANTPAARIELDAEILNVCEQGAP